ncbi:MAG: hypothetical protein M0Q95_09285 [Porticoccaceae bacterium]|nr:hypothetical protein [Porticoccaceae bacterium]
MNNLPFESQKHINIIKTPLKSPGKGLHGIILKRYRHHWDQQSVKRLQRFSLLIIITILSGLSFQAGYALVQPDLQLDSVSVSLLPEYIQPTVLVIYEINLDESIPLPQELIFEIPADAEVLTVINFSPEDRPIELSFREAPFGSWKDLRFTAIHRRLHIEYQDPNLVRFHNQRTYEFRWLSMYTVAHLLINVRQPVDASTIISQPPLRKMGNEFDESPIFMASFGKIAAGELFSLSIEYHKGSGSLAYPALPVSPAKPIDETAQGRTPSPIYVIGWVLTLSVAIALIVGSIYIRFRKKEVDNSTHIARGERVINPERQTFFCHECGMRTRVGENYCSNCGTELRKPTPFEQQSTRS